MGVSVEGLLGEGENMLVKSRSLARLAFTSAGLALAIASGCGKDSASSGSGNSNTNWLRVCDADADCGTGLSCICGVCTLECTSQTDCGGLDSAAMCATNSKLPSACKVSGLCLRHASLPDAS